jgi:hypothetical protein
LRLTRALAITSIVASISLFGAVSATLARYQYNVYAILRYSGASIGDSEVFEIGVKSSVELEDYATYGMSLDDSSNEGDYLYRAPSGLDSQVLRYVLTENGYAFNSLDGVSSGAFKVGDTLKLKPALTYKDNYTNKTAEKKNYVHLDLAFRVVDYTNGGSSLLSDKKVYLKSAELDGEGDISSSTRIHFVTPSLDEDEGATSFLFNPSSVDDGYDTVGGVLDLNNDGLYDYSEISSGNRKEYAYGEFSEGPFYKDEVTTDGVDSGEKDGTNSFLAEHKNGVYALDFSKSAAATSQYYGTSTINTKVLTETQEDGIAYLSIDIYLEGWSTYFTNEELGNRFGLKLEFGSD